MKKKITIEFDQKREIMELHLNEEGSKFLRDLFSKLIESNTDIDYHFMSSDWGGDELSSDQENLDNDIKLIHHLKILYTKQ